MYLLMQINLIKIKSLYGVNSNWKIAAAEFYLPLQPAGKPAGCFSGA
ncbi:hypothetical protein ACYUJ6_05045 [Clostridium sp. JNZ X4-2]